MHVRLVGIVAFLLSIRNNVLLPKIVRIFLLISLLLIKDVLENDDFGFKELLVLAFRFNIVRLRQSSSVNFFINYICSKIILETSSL